MRIGLDLNVALTGLLNIISGGFVFITRASSFTFGIDWILFIPSSALRIPYVIVTGIRSGKGTYFNAIYFPAAYTLPSARLLGYPIELSFNSADMYCYYFGEIISTACSY